MRKQLEEIRIIDAFLHDALPDEERLVVEARLLVSPALREELQQQKRVNILVKLFGRRERKKQLNQIYSSLMKQDPSFRAEVVQIFK